jgi:hypothetical protein
MAVVAVVVVQAMTLAPDLETARVVETVRAVVELRMSHAGFAE